MMRYPITFIICVIWCGIVNASWATDHEEKYRHDEFAVERQPRQIPTCNSGLCQGICRPNGRDCRADEMIAPSGCTCDSAHQCCITDPTSQDCEADCNGVCRMNYCRALEMEAPSGCNCGGNSVCCIADPSAIACGDCDGVCRASCNFGEMEAPGACTCGQDRTCCIADPTVQRCRADCGGRCRTQCLLGERQSPGLCYCRDDGDEPSFCCVDDPNVQVCKSECNGTCRYSDCRGYEHNAPTGCECSQGSIGGRVCCQEPPGEPIPTEGPTEDGTGSGDPHFMTFDHSKFSFQGNCTYVLVQDCENENPLFVIEIKNVYGRLHDSLPVSRIHAVVIRADGHEIEMNQHKVVVVDDGKVSRQALPVKLNEGSTTAPEIDISTSDGTITAEIKPDIAVKWDGSTRVTVSVGYTLSSKVCGLLGNADGDETNDLVDNNGDPISIQEFTDRWRVLGSC